MGKLQNEDHKTLAELTAAGGSASQLMNDTKVYVTAKAINKQLSQAITDGDIGGGGYEYILDPNSLPSLTGWSNFLDTPSILPTDGSGGSPSGNLDLLVSGNEYQLAKSGSANLQGEGVSIDKTLPVDMRGKVVSVRFDYNVLSGVYVDDTIIVYAYDATNGALIHQFTPYKIKNHLLSSDQFFGELQTPYNCATIRFMFYVAGTSTNNFTLSIRNLSLGLIANSVASEGVGFRANNSSTSISAVNTKIIWSSVDKDDLGGYSSGDYTVKRAGWYDIDATLYVTTLPVVDSNASLSILKNGSTIKATIHRYKVASTTNTSLNVSDRFYFNAGDTISIYAAVEGSSQAIVASGILNTFSLNLVSGQAENSSTMVVGMTAYKGSNQTINSTPTDVVFDGIVTDTVNKYNASTGEYTIGQSGYYDVDLNVRIDTGASVPSQVVITLKKNGADDTILSAGTNYQASKAHGVVCMIKNKLFNAGDVLKISMSGTSTSFTLFGSGQSFFMISKNQGPAQTPASTSISASYSTNTAQSIPTGVVTIINFDDLDYDSIGSVSTGASWKFTAPISGEYEVIGAIMYSEAVFSVDDKVVLSLYKNGGEYRNLEYREITATVTQYVRIKGSAKVKLLAGEYVDLRTFQNSGSSKTLIAGTIYNYVYVTKVGNY